MNWEDNIMVEMKIIEIVVREIEVNDIVFCRDRKGNWLHKNWCALPYYDKFGCPNLDRCKNEPLLLDEYDEPFIIIGFKCDYFDYLDKMRTSFPDWSERKIRIPYLWQKRIDRLLQEKTKEVIYDYNKKGVFDLSYMKRPEINGVFVIATMIRLGYEIELKPKKIIWKIYLVGRRIKGNIQKNIMEFF